MIATTGAIASLWRAWRGPGAGGAIAWDPAGAKRGQDGTAKCFTADVCGNCGYTEFYVNDPKGLLAAAKQAESRD